MNLKLIPFTELEKKKNYTFTAFKELDVKMIMLNEVTNFNKIPSGNFYKFGLKLGDELFWYFNSVAVADSRSKMREIYSAITQVQKEGVPFIYKLKKR
jgi:hypothetical protein